MTDTTADYNGAVPVPVIVPLSAWFTLQQAQAGTVIGSAGAPIGSAGSELGTGGVGAGNVPKEQ